MNRRNFLRTTLGLAAGTAAAAPMASAAITNESAPRPISLNTNIPIRRLGKTGYHLPVFGIGGAGYADNHADYFGVPLESRETRVAMLRRAYEQGVRYFDTARIYGDSESITGEALHDVRDDVYLVTKAMTFRPEDVRPSVEQSLESLRTDRVDCLLLHGPVYERLGFEDAMGIHAELIKLRDEGLCQFVGLSGHTRFEIMRQLICTGGFDQLLIENGYFRKGYNTRHSNTTLEWREMCVAEAHERDMALVAMKALGAHILGRQSAQLVPDFPEEARKRVPGAAIRHVLRDERIQVLIVGLSVPDDLEDNLRTFTGDLTFTNADRALLAQYAERAYQTPKVEEMRLV